jgi:hypothetical protein
VIFRTAEQKADVSRSWHRPDRPFFAAGACHILAAAFLAAYPDLGFDSYLILPRPGMRGGHIFVADETIVFDYHGFSDRDRFLDHYFRKIRRLSPGWQGELLRLEVSPAGADFCHKHRHRLPSEFPHDPFPRAFAYLRRFSLPGAISRPGQKSVGPCGEKGRR